MKTSAYKDKLLELINDDIVDLKDMASLLVAWLDDETAKEFYFANYDGYEYESDGQPDEQQEWQDFDPDC